MGKLSKPRNEDTIDLIIRGMVKNEEPKWVNFDAEEGVIKSQVCHVRLWSTASGNSLALTFRFRILSLPMFCKTRWILFNFCGFACSALNLFGQKLDLRRFGKIIKHGRVLANIAASRRSLAAAHKRGKGFWWRP
jgi:hypothetical protein